MAHSLATIREFNSQNISNTMWALAKMEATPKGAHPLVNALTVQARAQIGTFNAQAVANTIWALAKMEVAGVPSRLLMEALSARAQATIHQFNEQAVSNSLWALAKMQELELEPSPPLVDAMLAQARAKVRDFNAQHCSNTLWALAKMPSVLGQNMTLLGCLAMQARKNLADLTAQNLTNILWALAKIKDALDTQVADDSPAPCRLARADAASVQMLMERICPLLKSLQDEALRKVSLFNSQDVANSFWALTRTNSIAEPKRALINALVEQTVTRFQDFNALELSTVLRSLSKMGIALDPDGPLSRASARLAELRCQEEFQSRERIG